ncbi:MAG: acyltransferase [Pseudomonas sp.]|nr:acyltransferase [Pseudomonas sp.]
MPSNKTAYANGALASAQLDQIQALRGIAAILVVASHVHFFGKGAFGVDIFFCISGFIMMHVTRYDTRSFLMKRIVRVVPLYWLLTVLLFGIVSVKPHLFNSAEASLVFLIKSLLFIPFDRNGYVEPLLGPGWTLNYEMFFYLLFYISFRVSHNQRMWVCTALITWLVLMGVIYQPTGALARFYTSPMLFEFSFGMLAYELYQRLGQHAWGPKQRWLAGMAVVALGTWLFFASIEGRHYYRFLIWGVPALLVFVLSVLALRDVAIWRGFKRLGDISYSLYLTHIFIVLGFDRLVTSFSEFSVFALTVALAAIVACLLAAYAIWTVFEVRFGRWLSARMLPTYNNKITV